MHEYLLAGPKQQPSKFFEAGDMNIIDVFSTNLIHIPIDALKLLDEYRFKTGRRPGTDKATPQQQRGPHIYRSPI